MTRSPRCLAVVALSALAVSGCTSTVRTGAAAVVGGDRITSTQLQQVVDRSAAGASPAGKDGGALTRSVLGRLIAHDVLATAAREQGVSVTPAQVDATEDAVAKQAGGRDQLLTAAAQNGVSARDLRGVLSDFALRQALAAKLTADVPVDEAKLRAAYAAGIATFDRVHSAHILVAGKPLAERLLAQVKADPTRFAALAAQYSTDPGSKAQGGDLGFQGRGALAKPFETAIFGNPPGSFVLAHTTFGYHVIHVIARQTTSFEQARPDLRRAVIGQQTLDAAVASLLGRTARRLGVHVNPRYGTWDVRALDVVAGSSAVSRPLGGDPVQAPAGAPTG